MKKSTALCSIALALSSCFGGGEVSEPRYFSPSVVAAEASHRSLPALIYLEPVSVAPHLEGDRIAARVSATEIDYYRQHRWAGPLDRLLTQEVQRYFRMNRGSTTKKDSQEFARYQLVGHVERFEEIQEGESWSGLVGVQWTLNDLGSAKPTSSYYLESRKSAKARNPAAVVEALNEAFAEVLQKASEEIGKVVR